jgi:hypothetical protein
LGRKKKGKNSNQQLLPMDFVEYHEEIQKGKKRIEISSFQMLV